MSGEFTYLLSWIVAFALVGAVWYVIDRKIGVALYRWWYDLSHEKPLDASERRGFIYNQKARTKFTAATVLAILQTVLSVTHKGGNPVLEVVTFFVEIPAMLLGFYAGPFFFRIWERKNQILDKMDELESGETSIANELEEVKSRALQAVREAVKTGDDKPAGESKPEAAAAKKEEPADPQKMMDPYLRR